MLQSAGNLATTQEVLDRIAADLEHAGRAEASPPSRTCSRRRSTSGGSARGRRTNTSDALGANGSATFILGGQIAGAPPDILLVYPEGNYIRASDDRPFLQIGESKYGKFMLDIGVRAHADLASPTKIALGSMMSTARANLSVGPPYDSAVYRTGTFALDEHRFAADSAVLEQLREVWERNILHAVAELPDVELSEPGSRDAG